MEALVCLDALNYGESSGGPCVSNCCAPWQPGSCLPRPLVSITAARQRCPNIFSRISSNHMLLLCNNLELLRWAVQCAASNLLEPARGAVRKLLGTGCGIQVKLDGLWGAPLAIGQCCLRAGAVMLGVSCNPLLKACLTHDQACAPAIGPAAWTGAGFARTRGPSGSAVVGVLLCFEPHSHYPPDIIDGLHGCRYCGT